MRGSESRHCVDGRYGWSQIGNLLLGYRLCFSMVFGLRLFLGLGYGMFGGGIVRLEDDVTMSLWVPYVDIDGYVAYDDNEINRGFGEDREIACYQEVVLCDYTHTSTELTTSQ